jgi:hypothetical protein
LNTTSADQRAEERGGEGHMDWPSFLLENHPGGLLKPRLSIDLHGREVRVDDLNSSSLSNFDAFGEPCLDDAQVNHIAHCHDLGRRRRRRQRDRDREREIVREIERERERDRQKETEREMKRRGGREVWSHLKDPITRWRHSPVSVSLFFLETISIPNWPKPGSLASWWPYLCSAHIRADTQDDQALCARRDRDSLSITSDLDLRLGEVVQSLCQEDSCAKDTIPRLVDERREEEARTSFPQTIEG